MINLLIFLKKYQGLKWTNITEYQCCNPSTFFTMQMGFDSMYFARLDYLDKEERIKTHTMEQVWHSSQSLGSTSDLFFGALYYHYGPPPGFCYDVFCNDPPIMVKPKKIKNSGNPTDPIIFAKGRIRNFFFLLFINVFTMFVFLKTVLCVYIHYFV